MDAVPRSSDPHGSPTHSQARTRDAVTDSDSSPSPLSTSQASRRAVRGSTAAVPDQPLPQTAKLHHDALSLTSTPELVLTIVSAIAMVSAFALGASRVVLLLVSLSAFVLIVRQLWRSNSLRRRHAEDAMQQSEEEIEGWYQRWQRLSQEAQQTTTALSRMRDGVIMLSSEGRVLLINPAACYLLNLAPERNLHQRSFAEVARIPDLNRAIEATVREDGNQKVTIEVASADTVRPVKVRIDRFRVAGEDNLLLTLRDVSEARRVDDMRREFIANISHELKTPLAAIKGYAETVQLAVQDDPDAAGYFMTQIHSQCHRLERLIADMMQLARAQSGAGNMRLEAISLSDIVSESIKAYQPVAESKGVRLSVDDIDPPPRIIADPEATLTIANNLIGNAIRYTTEGGEVSVSYRSENRFWALVVKDSGVGIAKSEQKRVFERFYRVNKSRDPSDGGTGIGLSIVKNLTIAMDGEVRLQSDLGRGSTFEILLPAVNESA